MKKLFLFLLCVLNYCLLFGQGQGNKWFCYTSVVDFSGPTPVLVAPPQSQINASSPGYFPGGLLGAQVAICNPAGSLLFFVKILSMPNNGIQGPLYPGMPKIFDRNGYSMPNSDINANVNEYKSPRPIIIPHPGDTNLYYVFYTRNHGLQYALVDMTLNNGLGDVVASQKDVLLSGWGTIIGAKITAVPGCSGIWLVVRSRATNQYFSYLIDKEGLHDTPVISNCGLLPLSDYNAISIPTNAESWGVGLVGGRLAASKDGNYLAAGCSKGIELYDFEKCSGKVKNPRIIDSLPFFGVCFSPDDSKLYASQVYQVPYYGQQGQVYQFDLNQQTPQAITNSKTLVLSNNVIACWDLFKNCYCDTLSTLIGDLRLGPDDQIYMSNYYKHCASDGVGAAVPVYPPNFLITYHALHVIHNPNALGLTCNPEMNYLKLNTPVSYAGGGNSMELYMPNTIVIPPSPPDTIAGHSLPVVACFKDSVTLHAPENAHCPLWNNGSTEMKREIKEAGSYTLGYFNDACTYTIDTFWVSFVPKPDFPIYIHGCSGNISLQVKNKEGDHTTYSYDLRNEDSSFHESAENNTEYNFINLEAGNYTLQISTKQGCDTIFSIYLEGYPKPDITASPIDTLIRYGDSIQIRATGGKLYAWWPSGPLDTATKSNPIARPLKPVLFTVLGINDYGCSDTGYVHVDIDYSMPDIIPNAFSPNGDGLNDIFRIEGVTYQRLIQFRVFNRYGEQVFYTINPKNGWDGTYQGKPCDIGTYYYLIQLVYPDGREKTFKGNITLLR